MRPAKISLTSLLPKAKQTFVLGPTLMRGIFSQLCLLKSNISGFLRFGHGEQVFGRYDVWLWQTREKTLFHFCLIYLQNKRLNHESGNIIDSFDVDTVVCTRVKITSEKVSPKTCFIPLFNI